MGQNLSTVLLALRMAHREPTGPRLLCAHEPTLMLRSEIAHPPRTVFLWRRGLSSGLGRKVVGQHEVVPQRTADKLVRNERNRERADGNVPHLERERTSWGKEAAEP
jgi:hypothetical protein